MSIERHEPNTIMLSVTGFTEWNYQGADGVFGGRASEAVIPGQAIKLFNNGGVVDWKLNDSTTEQLSMAVALEQLVANTGITDAYAVDDLMRVAWIGVGAVFQGLVVSGTDLTNPAVVLAVNATGKFAVGLTTAAANVAKFQTLTAPGALAADTHVPMVRIQ